jgi:hypothetical protein
MGYMAGVKGVGDTFFGSVISQEGLIGIIAFSIALFGIAQYLNRIREVMAPGVLKEFTSLLTFSIVTGYVISALSGAPFLWNAMGIHMLFAGIVVGMKISTRTVISGGNQLS